MVQKNDNKKSGLNAPAYGTMLPRGTKVKTGADGKLEFIYPKNTKNTKKK